uniref:Uncharacterized protein n=1 Tax=Anguilla anguilla TaxID=7936 RepID=A0A0E9W637_ANGAN
MRILFQEKYGVNQTLKINFSKSFIYYYT